jgi:hypothetical protein
MSQFEFSARVSVSPHRPYGDQSRVVCFFLFALGREYQKFRNRADQQHEMRCLDAEVTPYDPNQFFAREVSFSSYGSLYTRNTLTKTHLWKGLMVFNTSVVHPEL